MTNSAAIASVIIPAHNEAAVMGRCLTALTTCAEAGELEVVVVANGCTDDTAAVARQHRAYDIAVIETATASKTHALNLADQVASAFPRIYLDADVTIDIDTARKLVVALNSGKALAAAPHMRVDAAGGSRLARAYAGVWSTLPVFQECYVGSGCYALSEAGRARFASFPEVIGDDRFVDSQFSHFEKLTLRDAELTVVAPRTLRSIISRSMRVRAGSSVLNHGAYPHRADARDPHARSSSRHLLDSARSPRQLGPVTLFAAVQLLIRLGAWWRIRTNRDHVWLRDETSRAVT